MVSQVTNAAPVLRISEPSGFLNLTVRGSPDLKTTEPVTSAKNRPLSQSCGAVDRGSGKVRLPVSPVEGPLVSSLGSPTGTPRSARNSLIVMLIDSN